MWSLGEYSILCPLNSNLMRRMAQEIRMAEIEVVT